MQGLWIGGTGAVLGLVVGLLLCFAQWKYNLIRLHGDVYFIESLPVRVLPMDVLCITLGALLVSLLAAWYPAWWASRLHPQEAIRYE